MCKGTFLLFTVNAVDSPMIWSLHKLLLFANQNFVATLSVRPTPNRMRWSVINDYWSLWFWFIYLWNNVYRYMYGWHTFETFFLLPLSNHSYGYSTNSFIDRPQIALLRHERSPITFAVYPFSIGKAIVFFLFRIVM